MTQGIDGEGPMIQEDCREKESPSQPAKPVNHVADGCGNQPWDPVELVEPEKFGVLFEIRNVFPDNLLVVVPKNPPDMAPPEACGVGRMGINFRVRMTMVVPVMGGPP